MRTRSGDSATWGFQGSILASLEFAHVKKRACIMKNVPRWRKQLQNAVKSVPCMLLHRQPRGGLIPKEKLVQSSRRLVAESGHR